MRPPDLDQQRDERIGDRVSGLELDELAAVGAAHRAQLNAREIPGVIESVLGKDLARSQPRLHRVDFVGPDVGDLDLRIQGSVERREETDVSETEGKRR